MSKYHQNIISKNSGLLLRNTRYNIVYSVWKLNKSDFIQFAISARVILAIFQQTSQICKVWIIKSVIGISYFKVNKPNILLFALISGFLTYKTIVFLKIWLFFQIINCKKRQHKWCFILRSTTWFHICLAKIVICK